MNELPQELIDRICLYLDVRDLKHTLLLSRKFQFSSEKASGAFTRRVLTAATAQKFIDTYGGYRLRYLRQVEFRPVFPCLQQSTEHLSCRESESEIRMRDESFSTQIRFLFKTLKSVEDSAGRYAPGHVQLILFTPTRQVDSKVCLHRRYVSWRVRLLSASALPELRSVRSLEVFHGATIDKINKADQTLFKLDYRVLIDLASKCTSLEYLSCNIGGDEWTPPFEDEIAQHFMEEYAGPTRDTRNDFATALQNVNLPQTLRRVQLDLLCPRSHVRYLDQRRSMPDLIGPAAQDLFSSSIKLLSPMLRKLQLRVVADESLFTDVTVTSFANIESVDVMFHPVHPDGSWYFKGPKKEGEDTIGRPITESDYPPLVTTGDDESFDYRLEDEGDRRFTIELAEFRVVPIDTKIVPLFTAFAKATATMPRLKEAALWSYVTWHPGELEVGYELKGLIDATKAGFGIQYLKPSEKVWSPRVGEDLSSSRQMWWSVGQWRPSPELHELCRDIGSREHGAALIEYWTDQQCGECLVPTDRFLDMNVLEDRTWMFDF